MDKYKNFFKKNKERIKKEEEEKIKYMSEQTKKIQKDLNISFSEASSIVSNHILLNKDFKEPITKENIKWLPAPKEWCLNSNEEEHHEKEEVAFKNGLEKDNYHIVERMSKFADSANETMVYKVYDGKTYIVWVSSNCNLNYKYESIIKNNEKIDEKIEFNSFTLNSINDY